MSSIFASGMTVGKSEYAKGLDSGILRHSMMPSQKWGCLLSFVENGCIEI
jgi:hypothetical protein